MSWVTVIWSMVASACLTLAAIYGFVWSRNRTAWAHLLFAATAASTAVFTFCELWLMRVETPEELLTALKWGHLSLLLWLVSIIWFVRLHLGAGRLWLAGRPVRPARVLPGTHVRAGADVSLPRGHEPSARPVAGRGRHDLHRHHQPMDADRPGAQFHGHLLRRGCQESRHGGEASAGRR